jgi:hypothetical protein
LEKFFIREETLGRGLEKYLAPRLPQYLDGWEVSGPTSPARWSGERYQFWKFSKSAPFFQIYFLTLFSKKFKWDDHLSAMCTCRGLQQLHRRVALAHLRRGCGSMAQGSSHGQRLDTWPDQLRSFFYNRSAPFCVEIKEEGEEKQIYFVGKKAKI